MLAMRSDVDPTYRRGTNLVDVLDRVLDKGLVVAGDIKVSLANVELLTIRVRLLVCSIDKAEEIGLNWWRYDPYLSRSQAGQVALENESLREQVRLLEEKLATSESAGATSSQRKRRAPAKRRAKKAPAKRGV